MSAMNADAGSVVASGMSESLAHETSWTSPGHCYRGGGYYLFHKDPSAAVDAPEDVLFFQNWGFGRSDEAWEATSHEGMPLERPKCPQCKVSLTADLDGLWFECLGCGHLFLDLLFRIHSARLSASKAEQLRRIHDEVPIKARIEEERKKSLLALAREQIRRLEEEKEHNRETVFAVLRGDVLVEGVPMLSVSAPCYFCGAKPQTCQILRVEGFFAVTCKACYGRGPLMDTRDEAVKTWNEAHSRPHPPERADKGEDSPQ